uniref:AB hydrolase-1 domain-containing protein n=1 Tax=Eutreptiella gymnastica TaxID=73025 RepID=A0A7S4CH28_9EUGL
MRWSRCLRQGQEVAKKWITRHLDSGATCQVWGSGPMPLVAINGNKGVEHLQKLSESLQWTSGVMVTAPPPTEAPQMPSTMSQSVKEILDECGIEFAHCIVHSWGAHVGLHIGYEYTDRMGCLIVLDTPIMTRALHDNYHLSQKLQRMRRDPNLSPEELAAAESQLLPEEPFAMDSEDGGLPSAMETMELSDVFFVQHPMCIIRPESGAWITDETLQAHQEVFNVRHHHVIPGCKSHEDLLSPQFAVAVAEVVDAFVNGYDIQHDVESRLEHFREQELNKHRAVRSQVAEKRKEDADGAAALDVQEKKTKTKAKPKVKKQKVPRKKLKGKLVEEELVQGAAGEGTA